MVPVSELAFASLLAMVLVSIPWWLLLRGRRKRLEALLAQVQVLEQGVRQLDTLREAVHRQCVQYLPVSRHPATVEEALRRIEELLAERFQESKHLHRRLVSALHTVNDLRSRERLQQERLEQLERVLVESPDYDLRAQFESLRRERDLYRKRVVQLQDLLASGDTDAASRMIGLCRENEDLRKELRAARRLQLVLERQVRTLDREDMERSGVAVRGLMRRDLQPGAFDSISDVPQAGPDEPVKL